LLRARSAGDKVLIDWSQNDDKKTTVGPYSLRGKREEPFVSLPVTWDELKKKQRRIDALFFTPAGALQRVQKLGDLFAPVLALKQKLPARFVAAAHRAPPMRAPRALARYAAKRDFHQTAEPPPRASAAPRGRWQSNRVGARRRFVPPN